MDQGAQLCRREVFVSISTSLNVAVGITELKLTLVSVSEIDTISSYVKIFENNCQSLSTDKDLLLKLTVKAMNDTLGPKDLVPFSIVFG